MSIFVEARVLSKHSTSTQLMVGVNKFFLVALSLGYTM